MWIATTFGARTVPVVTPDLANRVQVGVTATGAPVHEEIFRTGFSNIFSIVTRPKATHCSAVLIAASKEHRVGPARMWTELARELASLGVETVRFDRRGTGETTEVVAEELTPIYSAQSVADVHEVTGQLLHHNQNVSLVGLSSGSWMATVAAIERRVASVVLLSPANWSTKPARFGNRASVAVQRRLGRVEVAQAEVAKEAQVRVVRKRLKRVLARHVPYYAMIGLARVGVVAVPEAALAALAQAGVRTNVFLPPEDLASFVKRRGPEGLRRLAKWGHAPKVTVSKTGDHSLVHRGTRRHAMDLAVEAIAGVSPRV
jgi:pimeloyl-ACP methyl ester carboxylesterase